MEEKYARLGHESPELGGLEVNRVAEGADTGFPHSPRVRHVKFI